MRMIHIENAKPGMYVSRPIGTPENSAVPWVKQGTKLNTLLIENMRKRGVRFLYVSDGELNKKVKHPFMNDISALKPKPTITPELQREALQSLEDAFQCFSIDPDDVHASSVQIIKQMDRVVDQLVESIQDRREVLVNINDLKSYDDYTYHHSLSVAVLALAIGQKMALSHQDMKRLGMCAMLHDIGKTSVPIEIIQKPSKLSDKEFEMIKTHSPAGYDYLLKSALEDEEVCRGVLHHHEKMDGTGYPYGIKGEDIPFWSRIIAVADVYDALTSHRPYRTPMQPAEAIEYIMGSGGSAFDFDMVYAFVKKVELYPIGGLVELSTGQVASVLATSNPMRPVVRVLETGAIYNLFEDKYCLNMVIRRLLPSQPEMASG